MRNFEVKAALFIIIIAFIAVLNILLILIEKI
jgi:hypothetical protein